MREEPSTGSKSVCRRVRRERGETYRRSMLDLRRSSAGPFLGFVWKSCLVAVETVSIAARRMPERKSASTDRWN